MHAAHDIEKLLSETPAPGVKAGLHRMILKQELLARLQMKEEPVHEESECRAGKSSSAFRTRPWFLNLRPGWIAAASAAAAVVVAAAIFAVKPTAGRTAVQPPDSPNVAARDSPETAGPAIQPAPSDNRSAPEEGEGRRLAQRRSLAQCVADAQAIVVAAALDSAPAPAKRPGDPPENAIRFRAARTLKGALAGTEITVRTPTAAAELIGKDWVLLLSPEYLAGKTPYAGCYSIRVESEVAAILEKTVKQDT